MPLQSPSPPTDGSPVPGQIQGVKGPNNLPLQETATIILLCKMVFASEIFGIDRANKAERGIHISPE